MARRLRRRLAGGKAPGFLRCSAGFMGPKTRWWGAAARAVNRPQGGVLRVSFPHVYVCSALGLMGDIASHSLILSNLLPPGESFPAPEHCGLGSGFTRLE